MVFENGTATSTFDLMNKLTTFMASVSGWTLWSNVGPYDKVYRSVGVNGKNEIFIRQRIGAVETFCRGADQHDYGNGDTGFLNFQSYVSFPQDGDAYAGASEIGQFGPRRFWASGNSSDNFAHQDVLSDQPGGASHVKTGTPESPGTPWENTPDYYAVARRRWTYQTGRPNGASQYYVSYKPIATDSHRYLYFADVAATSATGLRRYSLRRSGGHYNDDGTVDRYYQMPNLGFQNTYVVYAEDRRTRRPWLYVAGPQNTKFVKINLLNHNVTSITGPSWPDRGGGTISQEAKSGICWNGDQFIYMLRGGSGFNQDQNGDWGMLNIHTGVWKTTSNPENPAFRSIPSVPVNYQIYEITGLTFLDKRISGFEFDRLYISHRNRDAIYMELGENGLPHAGNSYWTPQGDMTQHGNYTTSGVIRITRSGRMFHGSHYTLGRATGIHETSPDTPGRAMLYSDFKEYGNIDWQSTSNCFFPEWGNYGTNTEFTDGYACRTRTSVGSDTEYIFIADADRVIVATKSNSLLNPVLSDNTYDWGVAYMGAIESSYSDTPYGEFSEDIEAGFSKKIKLNNADGTFIEGNKYFVIDTSGASYTFHHHIWNKTYTIAPSESVVVEKVEGDVVTVSLKHSYGAGSKIAIDPQPVGLFFWEVEKFQSTNVVNTQYDDRCGSDDPSAQMYTCPIPEGEVKSSAEGAIAANTNLPIWEYNISTGESEGAYTGSETRGKMKGMYALGKETGIGSDQTISIGDDVYYIIELSDYNKYVLIGPINT